MRIITAGIGLRAGHVLSILREAMPEAEVVGFYDPQPTHLEMIGTDVPRYPTLDAMLSDARADLLFVGSPNAFHLDQIRARSSASAMVSSTETTTGFSVKTRRPASSPALIWSRWKALGEPTKSRSALASESMASRVS